MVTPMMAQYLEIKGRYPDALLFYRMGDFYEMFFADAEAAAAALDIALTKRGQHLGRDIPMCGVPVHAAEGYLLTLIRKGFRVAIAEQLEDPAEAKKRGSKSVVKRDVVRLVTAAQTAKSPFVRLADKYALMLLPLTLALVLPACGSSTVGGGHDAAVDITAVPVDAEVLHGRPVRLRGRFETEYQFFVDNRVHRDQAGYHVITPLRLEGSDRRILVNRGWIPALARHSDVPQVDTPTGPVTLDGVTMVPGHRFFTLGTEAASAGWPAVWQNLDLERFARLAGVPVQPVIVQLDPSAPAGFAREWPRADERYERHLSYAYQWYGFGAAAGLTF